MKIPTLKYDLIFLLLVSFYTIIASSLLLFEPRIWPDEAYLADIAGNILGYGRMGTDLWGTIIFGAQNHFFWYPPLYLLSLAGFFKAFGISIFNQRIFTVLIGEAFLFIYYLFGKSITAKYKPWIGNFIVFSSIVLLIVDPIFQRGARIGRSEILVLFFITLGLLLFGSVFNKTNPKKKLIYFLSGLSIGLASITHLIASIFFIAIVAIILIQGRSKILTKPNVYLFLGFIAPLILWIVSISPNYYPFLKQLSLQRHYHKLVISHIEAVYKHGSVNEQLTYTIYIILTLLTLSWSLIKKNLNYLLIVFILILSWGICILGKLEWNSIYFLPFLYLLSTIISYNLIRSKKWFQKLVGISILIAFAYLVAVNIKTYVQSYKTYAAHKQDYEYVGREITSIIPQGKSVYLSSIPDFYFVLRNKYTLYQFPPLPPKVNEYLDLLDKTDYVVINIHLEAIYVGGLLARYVDLNKASEYTVGSSALYQARVIELIPRNKRYKP